MKPLLPFAPFAEESSKTMAWRKSWSNLNIFGQNGDSNCSKRRLLPDERSVWDDYLDLASMSVLRGKVCLSGEMGYTQEQLSKLLKTPKKIIDRAETQMVEFKMITIDNSNRVISIKNWKKYQSEYERQKGYRKENKLQHKVTSEGYTEGYKVDIDIELDNTTNPKPLLEYFVLKYKEKTTKDYVINWAKDLKILKDLLKILSEGELRGRIDQFFDGKDAFREQAGYTVGVFRSQINRLGQEKPNDVWSSPIK